jgi:uroporphyrinogen III methyltransferase / synthase
VTGAQHPGPHSPDARRAPTAQPLAGKRVLVTRRAEQAGELSRILAGRGAEVVEVPMIRLEPPTDVEAAVSAIDAFSGYDYVVFTSVNAVAAVEVLAAERGVDLAMAGPVVVAVGPSTADALAGIGLSSESLPEEFSAAGVARMLESRPITGRRVLLPRSEVGGEELPAALRRLGARVDDTAFYLTSPDPEAPVRLLKALPRLDVITFASGSALEGFRSAIPRGWRRPPGLVIAVIGPAAASAARLAGLEPDIEAAEHTARGLADAIAAYFERT